MKTFSLFDHKTREILSPVLPYNTIIVECTELLYAAGI